MTREEQLDWLCRLRSEIYVFMPKEWLIPMNSALDMAIKALEMPELTASEKKFLTDIINAYAGLVNIQIVKRIYDVTRDSYYLKFKDDINSSDSSNTFSCFHGMFTELEEGKDYNIRKLLGKDY